MSKSNISLSMAIEAFLDSQTAFPSMRSELSRFAMLCGKGCPMFMVTTTATKEFIMAVKKTAERKKRAEALEVFFGFAKENGWVHMNPAAGLIQNKGAKRSPVISKTPKRATIQLTPEGRQEIETEIEGLLIRKKKVIAEVAAAREEGDLKENAGYHDARERLAIIEAQLRKKTDIITRVVPPR